MAKVFTCRSCKFFTDVNRIIAPDRGWCSIWQKWQKMRANSCKYAEQREQKFTKRSDKTN